MINNKRQSLERFIKEQILGPGICGHRFVNIDDNSLFENDLLSTNPIDYKNELINTVPASVYSTGILFPENKSNEAVIDEKEEVEEDEQLLGGKEDDQGSIEENDLIRIDQMFPNTMGFTCCFNGDILNEPIEIRLRARYYYKVDRKNEDYNKKYGVLCECDSKKFLNFIEANDLDDFRIKSINGNNILLSNKLKNDQITELRKKIKDVIHDKALEFNKTARSLDIEIRNIHLSSIKQACFYELKNNCLESDKKQSVYLLSQEIEEIESYLSHINDIISLNDSRSYGLWQSVPLDTLVQVPEKITSDFKGKKIFSYSKYESLKNVWKYEFKESIAALSINIQFSKDTRRDNDNIFLKVQLINTSTPFEKKETDSRYFSGFNEIVNQRCFFGVKLSITNTLLVPYNEINYSKGSNINEDDLTKFSYRQFKDYGIGHGCSVKWEINDNSKTVETTYIPECNTPDVDPTPKRKDFEFDEKAKKMLETEQGFAPSPFLNSLRPLEFKWLSIFSSTENEEIILGLKEFVDTYKEWIEIKTIKYKATDKKTKVIIENQLSECESDYKRMLRNIENHLEGSTNENNLLSFRLMNSAMFMQMWHAQSIKSNSVTEVLKKESFKGFDFTFYCDAKDDFYKKDSPATWRAFQLAFILLNLDGIFKNESDTKWNKRNGLVDLVWFPTGGGKTEAYLGIIALTIISRRRKFGLSGGGTTAIMRYTLRLLTLQQFQRAALMIMALELIRRWNKYGLGVEPIFIGLWVGDNSLPNRMDDLIKEFQKFADGQKSRIPFDACPWCNSELSISHSPMAIPEKEDYFHYNRLHLYCSEDKCSFTEDVWGEKNPIPVSLCDEEIYQHPPALLFGTVDKFAQLAHKVSNNPRKRNKDSRRLFGRGNWERDKPQGGYLPPDLIIQDELHLLLGPLGSAVALFESAIDQLCTREDGTRPKIISSTATTRNTDLQIMALFDREVNLFPKPGVECDDSFFAFYKRNFNAPITTNSEYLSKRKYLGFLPTGRTQIWMQMRLVAILLTHRAIFELQCLDKKHPIDFEVYDDKILNAIDYYHTIVSYFNSLREVGKTESQIQSYILKEIRRVFYRRVRPGKLMDGFYTYSIKSAELTGRLSGEEVKIN